MLKYEFLFSVYIFLVPFYRLILQKHSLDLRLHSDLCWITNGGFFLFLYIWTDWFLGRDNCVSNIYIFLWNVKRNILSLVYTLICISTTIWRPQSYRLLLLTIDLNDDDKYELFLFSLIIKLEVQLTKREILPLFRKSDTFKT